MSKRPQMKMKKLTVVRRVLLAGFLLAIVLAAQSADAERWELAQGWNLFSLPKLPPDGAISQVFDGVLDRVRVIWGYDNEAKRWRRYVPQGGNNTLSTLEVAKGYWILLDNALSLDISAWEAIVPPRITLYPFWNLMGYHEEEGAGAAGKLNNPTIWYRWVGLWSWQAGWQAKERYFTDLPVDPLATMHQGRAYWISILPWAGPFEYNPFPPGISVSPSSVNFGTVAYGDSSTRQVTVSNTGTGPLTVQSIAITGTDWGQYSLSTSCGVVSPGSSCAVDVSFAPVSQGEKEASLLITSDDPQRPLTEVALAGTGGPHPDAIRTYHIGDTFVYDTVGERGGIEAGGTVTNFLAEEVMNPYGVVCASAVMTGTLTAYVFPMVITIPVDSKTLYYQDGQGNLYDCGHYRKDTGQYVFVEDRAESPKGLSLILESPVRVGNSVSGATYYTNGTSKDCTSTITTRENVLTGAGTFNAFKEVSTCTASGGSTTTSTRWFYPQIFYVKTVETSPGENPPSTTATVTATLDSYTIAP